MTSRAGSASGNGNNISKEGLGRSASSSSSSEVGVGSDVRAAAVGSTRPASYAGVDGEGGGRRGGVEKTQQRSAPATRERGGSSSDLAVEDDTPRGGEACDFIFYYNDKRNMANASACCRLLSCARRMSAWLKIPASGWSLLDHVFVLVSLRQRRFTNMPAGRSPREAALGKMVQARVLEG